MPIYEYACSACGHAFEEWQKMSDAPVTTCPKCKKKKVQKLISQTAFQLKGGGWYKDLYSSSKSGGDKAGDKSAGGDSSAKAEGSSGGNSSGGSDSSGSASPAGGGGKDAGSSGRAAKSDSKGDVKDAKKKDTPKKSKSRAA